MVLEVKIWKISMFRAKCKEKNVRAANSRTTLSATAFNKRPRGQSLELSIGSTTTARVRIIRARIRM